jgi:ubiquinone/menaquinone biosynthesis C-methylase UbiE
MSKRLQFFLKTLPFTTQIQKVLRPWGIKQLPPLYLRRLVGGMADDQNYIAGAQMTLKRVIADTHLKPNSRVLDVGCGCGAAALVLQKYLHKSGQYEGFDIYPELVYWCQQMIEAKDARFHFRLANITNHQYNPKGTIKAQDYTYMYPDNYFDLVIAWSVHTHLLEADLKHYLSETARVLKPGGYAWISYFLMRDKAKLAIKQHQSVLTFKVKQTKSSWSEQSTIPETAVCYAEKSLHAWHKANHLHITNTHYGKWISQPDIFDFQDIVVAKKE